jgi:nucleotide-binding universal stress UspA family protein
MFERVLTATNMLEACDVAVISALEIAKQNHGKLFVMHVLEPSYFHECGPRELIKDSRTGKEIAASPEYFDSVKEELDKKCAGALKPYGNYQIDIAYGKPSIEIRRSARKMGAELIVLGPHAVRTEEEGLIGLRIGDTVEDVIMHTTVPVMIINRLIPKERLNFKKIMVGVDFSKSCEHAFQFSTKLAQKYNSKLFLFHMLTTTPSGHPQAATDKDISTRKEKLREFCKIPEGIEHEYVVSEGTLPYVEILKYSREKDADLIIMGSHTKEEGTRDYVGSSVEQVSAKSICPVVVVTHTDALLK